MPCMGGWRLHIWIMHLHDIIWVGTASGVHVRQHWPVLRLEILGAPSVLRYGPQRRCWTHWWQPRVEDFAAATQPLARARIWRRCPAQYRVCRCARAWRHMMMQGDSVNSHPWAFGEPYYALDSLDSFRSVLGVPKSKQEWSTTQRDRMARFRPLLSDCRNCSGDGNIGSRPIVQQAKPPSTHQSSWRCSWSLRVFELFLHNRSDALRMR